MDNTQRIVCLPGDGIGPEVLDAAWQVLETVARHTDLKFARTDHLIGGAAIDETGSALPKATLSACQEADAVLLGAVGGPRWDAGKVRPEQGLLALRKGLSVYANLRPVKPLEAVAYASPLRPERLKNVDFLVVRELTGGVYFGQPKRQEDAEGQRCALDTMVYTEAEIRRVVRLAFRLAHKRKRKLTSIDKANVLECSKLWRRVVVELAPEFPDVTVEHQLVDSAAMRIITHPQDFDVIVTGNLFGDILTDEAAVLGGSLGLLPSAALGDQHPFLYEPVHGSAPDIEGQGVANPIGAIASVAMMLRYSFDHEPAASCVERAIELAVHDGAKTRDLGGQRTTQNVTDMVKTHFKENKSWF